MSLSSLQLEIESALKAFLASGLGTLSSGYELHAAHAIDTLPDEGNFIAINATPPYWEEFISNGESRVVIRIATQVSDPDARTAAAIAHKQLAGAIVDLLSYQNFPDARGDLNAIGIDLSPVAIGFTGWEADKPNRDLAQGVQLITELPYQMIVFIAAADSSS